VYNKDIYHLMGSATSFQKSKILLEANDLDLFSILSAGPRKINDLASQMRVDSSALGIIMNALVTMGFLVKEYDFYKNSAVSDRYLAKGAIEYRGNYLKLLNIQWNLWSNLGEVVRSRGHNTAFLASMHNKRSMNHVRARGMDELNKSRADFIAHVLNLRGPTRMLDLGGGAATYSIAFARKNPQLSSVVLDMPFPLEVARENIQRHKLEDRISTMPGSFWKTDYGSGYDLVWISNVIHHLSPIQGEELILRSTAALSSGGRLIVHENTIDEDGISPPGTALFSALILAISQEGQCYTLNEIKNWLTRSSLNDVHQIELDSLSQLISGTKA